MIAWTALLDHLWQSTLFAAVAGLFTIALRKNHARVRYAIWLTASLKFLVPFALIVSLGERVQWRSAPEIGRPAAAVVIEQVSQPFAQFTIANPAPVKRPIWPVILWSAWLCGTLGVLIFWLLRWRRVFTALRTATPPTVELPIPVPIRVQQSRSAFEPGIFGVFRPILLLPEGFADRLTPAQLEAILAHEICHVRRHDNLTAAVHMVVEQRCEASVRKLTPGGS